MVTVPSTEYLVNRRVVVGAVCYGENGLSGYWVLGTSYCPARAGVIIRRPEAFFLTSPFSWA